MCIRDSESGGDQSGECGPLFFGGCGVVFKVDPSGNETVLHTFTGPDGAVPAGLLMDKKGTLYGITLNGGFESQNCQRPYFPGWGTVFQISMCD